MFYYPEIAANIYYYFPTIPFTLFPYKYTLYLSVCLSRSTSGSDDVLPLYHAVPCQWFARGYVCAYVCFLTQCVYQYIEREVHMEIQQDTIDWRWGAIFDRWQGVGRLHTHPSHVWYILK